MFIGLSKYTRIAQHLAQRGHLQEELTEMIAEENSKTSQKSDAVGVYIRARTWLFVRIGAFVSSKQFQLKLLSLRDV